MAQVRVANMSVSNIASSVIRAITETKWAVTSQAIHVTVYSNGNEAEDWVLQKFILPGMDYAEDIEKK